MNVSHFPIIRILIVITLGIFILVGAAKSSALSEQDQKIKPSQPAKTSWTPPRFSEYHRERSLMVQSQMMHRSPGVRDRAVLEAMRQVPRHLFVPRALKRAAHADRPLPIGHGQTISQPYIVGLMTEALKMKPNAKVLEIGTGSGYQAAVLSELTPRVFTIEIIRPLGQEAGERLQKLGYLTIKAKIGDGYFGWPEEAPFDGIIVTCAAGHIPTPLIEQLREGGRMVIPVGGTFEVQRLMVIIKDQEGKVKTEELLPVRFVPMTGAIRQQR
jgi:protein-L-isoaspartate(D-aspartate) O-methyltransferase